MNTKRMADGVDTDGSDDDDDDDDSDEYVHSSTQQHCDAG